MTKRKFEIEFAASIVCTAMLLGREKEYRVTPAAIADGCHIYAITRQPKITINPESVIITDSYFKATVLVQKGGHFDSYPVEMNHSGGPQRKSWRSEWPFDNFEVIDESTGEVFSSGPVALFVRQFSQLLPEKVFHQEVLYIGQSYGKKGERTAYDRLKSHETLQKIYSENKPDQEIWLTLCKITDVAMLQHFSPNGGNSTVSGRESTDRANSLVHWFYSEGFKRKEAIALAEAGLIRHFQPEYNKKFRNNFPDPQHISSATCYELEINHITIEFHCYGTGDMYWSEEAEPANMHFANYPLYSENDRAWLMDPLIEKNI